MSDNFKFVQAQPFTLAGAGVTIGDVEITLSAMKTIDGVDLTMTDFGIKGFITLEPGAGTQEEQITFSGITQNANGTATLTGVSNVSFLSPYTVTLGLSKTHAGGTTAVVSNTSGFYDELTGKDDDETINGVWTFNAVPNTPAPPVSGNDLTNKDYVLSVVNGGPISINQQIIAGTAGETVALGSSIYLKESDGKWHKTDATISSTVDNVLLGIAQGAGTSGFAITSGVLITGVFTTSGLTPDSKYYFSDTAGTLSTTPGTESVTAGFAVSATQLNFYPRYDELLSANIVSALAGGGDFGTPDTGNKYITQDYLSSPTGLPVVHVFTPSATRGATTTQFDITNPSGTTMRYTWDGTGTDPLIDASTFPINTVVQVYSRNMTLANTGTFTVTGSSTNYFEVTNGSGVAENNKTLGTNGFLIINQTYTKPVGLKYVIAEVVGGGGSGGGASAGGGGEHSGSGGGGGGYSRKLIPVSSLGTTEQIVIGKGGDANSTPASGLSGFLSSFGSFLSATGGSGGIKDGGVGGSGGIGSSGDINAAGQGGGGAIGISNYNTGAMGGNSVLGGGGGGAYADIGNDGGAYGGGGGGAQTAGTGNATQGGHGGAGVVIISEYYS